jgi:hypothetical protein
MGSGERSTHGLLDIYTDDTYRLHQSGKQKASVQSHLSGLLFLWCYVRVVLRWDEREPSCSSLLYIARRRLNSPVIKMLLRSVKRQQSMMKFELSCETNFDW